MLQLIWKENYLFVLEEEFFKDEKIALTQPGCTAGILWHQLMLLLWQLIHFNLHCNLDPLTLRWAEVGPDGHDLGPAGGGGGAGGGAAAARTRLAGTLSRGGARAGGRGRGQVSLGRHRYMIEEWGTDLLAGHRHTRRDIHTSRDYHRDLPHEV